MRFVTDLARLVGDFVERHRFGVCYTGDTGFVYVLPGIRVEVSRLS